MWCIWLVLFAVSEISEKSFIEHNLIKCKPFCLHHFILFNRKVTRYYLFIAFFSIFLIFRLLNVLMKPLSLYSALASEAALYSVILHPATRRNYVLCSKLIWSNFFKLACVGVCVCVHLYLVSYISSCRPSTVLAKIN